MSKLKYTIHSSVDENMEKTVVSHAPNSEHVASIIDSMEEKNFKYFVVVLNEDYEPMEEVIEEE